MTAIITSMTGAGYQLYGKNFIESYKKSGLTFKLYIYVEDFHEQVNCDGVEIIHLEDDCRELFRFREEYKHKKGPDDSYRFHWEKFAGKSFAIWKGTTSDLSDNIIWFDADTVFKQKINDVFFNRYFIDGIYSCYLGRKEYHTESGFLTFSTKHEIHKEFIYTFIDYYMTGEIFSLKEWHDCEAYDQARTYFDESYFFNLTPSAKGMHHVFVDHFHPFIDHLKGPSRKQIGQSPEFK